MFILQCSPYFPQIIDTPKLDAYHKADIWGRFYRCSYIEHHFIPSKKLEFQFNDSSFISGSQLFWFVVEDSPQRLFYLNKNLVSYTNNNNN